MCRLEAKRVMIEYVMVFLAGVLFSTVLRKVLRYVFGPSKETVRTYELMYADVLASIVIENLPHDERQEIIDKVDEAFQSLPGEVELHDEELVNLERDDAHER